MGSVVDMDFIIGIQAFSLDKIIEKEVDLFRSKGILAVKGMRDRFVFQAIHMLFANSKGKPWEPDEEKRCKMIFIGKNLNREELTSGFMRCFEACEEACRDAPLIEPTKGASGFR